MNLLSLKNIFKSILDVDTNIDSSSMRHNVQVPANNMRDIALLYVDQKRRDTFPVMLIAMYLRQLGVKVVIASYYDYLPKYYYYRPKIVLQGNIDVYHGRWARFISQYSVLLSLPTEQAITRQEYATERMMVGHNPSQEASAFLDGVYRFYLWGIRLHSFLENYSEFEGKLKIVGSPRLTAIHPDVVPVHNSPMNVGFVLEDEFNNVNLSEYIFANRKRHYHEYGGGPDRFIATNVMIAARLLEIIEYIYNNTPYSIEIRPRMTFDKKAYQLLLTTFPEIVVRDEDSPSELINQSDVLIAGQSSLGTEAQIAGKPVISIVGLIGPIANTLGFDTQSERIKGYWKPNSVQNLVELLNKRAGDNLDLSPDMAHFRATAKEVYLGNESKEHPAKIIASDIASIMRSENVTDIRVPITTTPQEPPRIVHRAISLVLNRLFAYGFRNRNPITFMLIAISYFIFRIGYYIAYRLGRIDETRIFVDYDRKTKRWYELYFDQLESSESTDKG